MCPDDGDNAYTWNHSPVRRVRPTCVRSRKRALPGPRPVPQRGFGGVALSSLRFFRCPLPSILALSIQLVISMLPGPRL